jgi:hypothetical protein
VTIFRFSAAVTVSAYTEVEADTQEEALEEAEGRDVVIGGLHTGADPGETWVIEEADGIPQNIRCD